MYDFAFLRPKNLDEAVEALQAEDAKALGGGQTLIPTLKQRLAQPSVLVALSGLGELRGIRPGKGEVRIGAATTHAEVAAETATIYPALAALAGHIGDPAVRNRGTIGGSLANNDPAACYPAAVLASGAVIETNLRSIAAEDFFQGLFTTALDEGEIITGVTFPLPERANYQKFGQPASRFALAGVFVAKYAAGTRVAVTGASENGVFRWTDAEAALDAEFSADNAAQVTLSPEGLAGDIHATPAYRAHLATVLLERAVRAA